MGVSSLLSSPSKLHNQSQHGSSFVDSSFLLKQTNVPSQFVWPEEDLVTAQEELMLPLVDLEGFLRGDQEATKQAAVIVRAACSKHGFFQVINHGIDSGLMNSALDQMDRFFNLPLDEKLRATKKPGTPYGYSGAHADRFASKLPWKEMLSVGFHEDPKSVVQDFFKTTVGEEYEQMGMIYQEYCEAMNKLSLKIMELLAISLEVEQMHYRQFYEDGHSLLRCNFYPSCQQPAVTLGTGPHCDPTSLTILLQDEVGGLEISSDNKWYSVKPCHGALAINIGDTFMALTNGKYKSCLHRALVNSQKNRKSVVFFLCPREDKVVKPPEELTRKEAGRLYPDFTWADLLHFTQKHYRADSATLENFSKWFSSEPVNT